MNVLIIGGGIAGLTCAAFLKQQGITPSMYDIGTLGGNLGFSLSLWRNALHIIEQLDGKEELARVTKPIPSYTIARGNGQQIKTFEFSRLQDKEFPIVQIKRSDLYSILRSHANADVQTNNPVRTIHQTNYGVEVTYNDGSHKVYDVIVGADGAHSTIRSLFFQDSVLKYVGWRAWYLWVSPASAFGDGIFEMVEPKQFFGVFPHGENIACGVLASPVPHAEFESPQERLHLLRSLFPDITYKLPQLLAGYENPEQMYVTNLYNLRCKRFARGRIVLIGDAAHAMEPFAGMGASTAIEDGFVLARSLAHAGDNIPLALAVYEAKRRSKIAFAQRASRRIACWTRVESHYASSLRHLVAPYVPLPYFTSSIAASIAQP